MRGEILHPVAPESESFSFESTVFKIEYHIVNKQMAVLTSSEYPADQRHQPETTPAQSVAIVIPVYNQLHYTRQCLESLRHASVAESQIIIINNGSTDGTKKFLASHPQIRTINNAENLGCGCAWTQGATRSDAAWTVILNNDVLVPPGCMEQLINFAEQNGFDIICPAMCEGDADYDFPTHAADFMQHMKSVCRQDAAHGVCFAVHRRVFDAVGFFSDDSKLGGYEDDEYFRRVRRRGFRLAITGSALIHHFGSITQKSIKQESKGAITSIGDREYYRRATRQSWLERKFAQTRDSLRSAWWRNREQRRYGHTLREQRIAGVVKHL